MKLMKKKGYEGSIRKVYDGLNYLGVIGTVGDLLKEEILEYCDYSRTTWAFISLKEAYFGASRQDVLDMLKRLGYK